VVEDNMSKAISTAEHTRDCPEITRSNFPEAVPW
jgi:hypothetical protein